MVDVMGEESRELVLTGVSGATFRQRGAVMESWGVCGAEFGGRLPLGGIGEGGIRAVGGMVADLARNRLQICLLTGRLSPAHSWAGANCEDFGQYPPKWNSFGRTFRQLAPALAVLPLRELRLRPLLRAQIRHLKSCLLAKASLKLLSCAIGTSNRATI